METKLIDIQVKENSYVLPPEVLDIKLVRIISDIKKPLDQLTIQDICDWHEKTKNNYIEFSIPMPDKYSVEYSGDGRYKQYTFSTSPLESIEKNEPIRYKEPEPVFLEIGDKISSDEIRNGAILKCIAIVTTDDGEYVTWEDFAGGIGYAKANIFKKYVPGIDKFVMVKTEDKKTDISSTILNMFRISTGSVMVHVLSPEFKVGDYLSENVYVKAIYQYTGFYGLVLEIDMKAFENMGYTNQKIDKRPFLTNVENGIVKQGMLILPDVIVENVYTDEFYKTSICSLRVYEKKFEVGTVIKKLNKTNYYGNPRIEP